MSVKTRIDPIDRDVKLIVDELLSPAAQSRQFAESAQVLLDEADEINQSVLGRIPPYQTYVDGREGADLASVRMPGTIVREYELVIDVLIYISEELRSVSPVGKGPDRRPGHPGFYRASHTLFADGTEVAINATIPDAEQYVFLSDAPYARKLERKDTIYEMIAAKANKRFGNVARISFGYRSMYSGHVADWAATTRISHRGHASTKTRADWLTRQPAIFVTMGK